MEPLVSVVMPVYNESSYLNESMESILGQTYRNFELIAVDDGSSDNSVNIITDYIRRDRRVKLVLKQNSGVADSLNHGIRLAEGEYICRMDADDIMHPQRIEKQLRFMQNSSCNLSVTHTDIFGNISEEKKIIQENEYNLKEVSLETLAGGYHAICHPSVMFRKDIVNRIGFYNPNKRCEDWDYWFRALSAGLAFDVIPERLYRVRRHKSSATQIRLPEMSVELKTTKLAVLKKYLDSFEMYFIWGTGANGKAAYEALSKTYPERNLTAFIDSYTEGKFLGKPIKKPACLSDKDGSYVFVATDSGREYADSFLSDAGYVKFRDYIIF